MASRNGLSKQFRASEAGCGVDLFSAAKRHILAGEAVLRNSPARTLSIKIESRNFHFPWNQPPITRKPCLRIEPASRLPTRAKNRTHPPKSCRQVAQITARTTAKITARTTAIDPLNPAMPPGSPMRSLCQSLALTILQALKSVFSALSALFAANARPVAPPRSASSR